MLLDIEIINPPNMVAIYTKGFILIKEYLLKKLKLTMVSLNLKPLEIISSINMTIKNIKDLYLSFPYLLQDCPEK